SNNAAWQQGGCQYHQYGRAEQATTIHVFLPISNVSTYTRAYGLRVLLILNVAPRPPNEAASKFRNSRTIAASPRWRKRGILRTSRRSSEALCNPGWPAKR